MYDFYTSLFGNLKSVRLCWSENMFMFKFFPPITFRFRRISLHKSFSFSLIFCTQHGRRERSFSIEWHDTTFFFFANLILEHFWQSSQFGASFCLQRKVVIFLFIISESLCGRFNFQLEKIVRHGNGRNTNWGKNHENYYAYIWGKTPHQFNLFLYSEFVWERLPTPTLK